MTSKSDEMWPSQDDVDRSAAFAIIAIMSFDWKEGLDLPGAGVSAFPIEVRAQLQSAVNIAISEVSGEYPVYPVTVEHYQVGPAAGGLAEHYIATVWENREEIAVGLTAVSTAFDVMDIARRVKNKLNVWASSITWPGSTTHPKVVQAYPPATLQDFCIEHVRRTYHPKARLRATWHVLTKEFYAGYQSPAHPTTNMEYMVVVEAGDKKYSYHVMGTAEVRSLGLRDGNVAANLPIPDLLPAPDVVIPRPEDDSD